MLNFSKCLFAVTNILIFLLFISSCNPSTVQTIKLHQTADSTVAKKDSTHKQIDSLYFNNIPDQVTDEFHEFSLLDLKPFLRTNFNLDSLKWSFKPVKNLNIFLDEKRRVLALRIKPDWTGVETVNFLVKSSKKDSASVKIRFVVNSLPVLADIPDQTIGKGMEFNKIKLNLYLKDKNNKANEFRWEITGAEKVKITLDRKNQAKIVPLKNDWTGSDTVYFKAFDPYGVYAGDAVVFTVDPNYSIYNMQPNLYLRSAGSLKKMPTGEQFLINNVHIDYKEYGIKCDTAIINQDRTETRLFGNVFIWDTLRTVTAKRAEIFKEKEKNRIFLYDDVKIDQDSVRIFGKNAVFQQQFNIANVQENVIVEFTSYPAILKSRHLSYNLNKKDLFATMVESLVAVDSVTQYQLTTSTISFNDSTQTLKLPTKFTLTTKQMMSQIKDFTKLKKENFGGLFDRLLIKSPDGNTLSALKGEYNMKDKKAYLWDNVTAVAIENNGKDTTKLFADTAFYDLTTQRLNLFGNVKVLRDSLKATADLAIFYKDDKRLKLLEKPEMFFGISYMKGDSVDVFFNKDSTSNYPEKVVILGNGFMESPAKTVLESEKNNLYGQQIELFFKNRKIDRMKAFGQVTSLFYNKDENKKSTDSVQVIQPLKEAAGANQVTGDTLFVQLKDNKVQNIHFKGGCEGTYYPRKYKKLIKK